MKEIKFRSWLKEEKRMLFEFIMDSPAETESKTHVLMQYTGLNDKNETPIYEGDILKCKRTKIHHKDEFDWAGEIETFFKNSVIEWWQSFTNIGYRLRDVNGKTMMVKPSSLSKMEVEAIGNIYENPELLEKTNELP